MKNLCHAILRGADPNRLPAVIDIVSNAKSAVHDLTGAIIRLSAIYLATNVALASQIAFSQFAAERLARRLRLAAYSRLLNRPLAYFDKAKSGDVLSGLGTDVELTQQVVRQLLGTRGVRSVIELVGVVAVLAWISAKMAVLLVLTVPLMGPVTKFLTERIQAVSAKVQAAAAGAAAVAGETIEGIQTIRVFGGEDEAKRKYQEHLDESHRHSVHVAWLQGLLGGANRVTTSLSIMATIGYGAYLAFTGEVTAGTAYTFFVYSLTLGISLGTLSSVVRARVGRTGLSCPPFPTDLRAPRPLPLSAGRRICPGGSQPGPGAATDRRGSLEGWCQGAAPASRGALFR